MTTNNLNRPYVAIQFGASLDGKIATSTGDSKWINNEAARQFGRRLRGKYQAILVGINTVIVDDPHLGTRITGLKDPLRIILDSSLRIPLKSQVLRDSNVLIVTTKKAEESKLELLKQKNIKVLVFESSPIPIEDLLTKLKEEFGVDSLLVEGGGKTLGNFVDAKMVDRVYAFFGPLIIGGTTSVSAIAGQGASTLKQALHLKNIKVKIFEDDTLIMGDYQP
jgi:diaminohydroxyphosphoribosylaminopyrimidine deaminase / 5-amino-6-(5-phosphoribosylamino)uracil reductase